MDQVSVSASNERFTGMVKWFNNKSGFGFITVCDGETCHSGKDIFVHYSSIRVSDIQYKYLVQGEYVDFTIVSSENDNHEYQATDVCGVKGGCIMCETRNTLVQQKPHVAKTPRPATTPQRPYTKLANSEPPMRPSTTDDDGFTRVVKKRPRQQRAPLVKA